MDGEKNIFVGHGESVQGAVPKFGFAYYQVRLRVRVSPNLTLSLLPG